MWGLMAIGVTVVWLLDKNMAVKSFCKDMDSNGGISNLVESLVWKGLVPPKVECFAWLAIQYPNLFNINILCPFCSNHVETTDHVLLRCEYS